MEVPNVFYKGVALPYEMVKNFEMLDRLKFADDEIDPDEGIYFSRDELKIFREIYIQFREDELVGELLNSLRLDDESFVQLLKMLDIDPSEYPKPSLFLALGLHEFDLAKNYVENVKKLGEEQARNLQQLEIEALVEKYKMQQKTDYLILRKVKSRSKTLDKLKTEIALAPTTRESKRAPKPELLPTEPDLVPEIVTDLAQERLATLGRMRKTKELTELAIDKLRDEEQKQVRSAAEDLRDKFFDKKKKKKRLRKRQDEEERLIRKIQKETEKEVTREFAELGPLPKEARELEAEAKKLSRELEEETQEEEEMSQFFTEITPEERRAQQFLESLTRSSRGLGFRKRRKHKRGAGIGDFFKEAYSRVKGFIEGPRENAPPIVRNFLSSYGNLEILSMVVCREPIATGIKIALDVVSLGEFSQKAKEEGYDNMFHLYLYADVKFNDGTIKTVVMEKNQVARVEFVQTLHKGECMPVPLHGKVTISEFLERGEKYQGKGFWNYNPQNNNCQVFVISCLRGNQATSPTLEKFVVQNAENILTGFAKKLGVAVTDLAGRFDILLHGRALQIIPSPPKRTLPKIRY